MSAMSNSPIAPRGSLPSDPQARNRTGKWTGLLP